jgi:PAS domain S-box-containing protein
MRDATSHPLVRIVLPYAAFAALWIYVSDRLLAILVTDPVLVTQLQTYKGLAFILTTSVLLYYLLNRQLAQRKRVESEQRRLHSRILNILESTTDGFVALDKDWHYAYVNRRAAEMFGRKPGDLIGKHIWTEFPEAVGQPFYHAYQRVMDEHVPLTIEEYYAPWERWFENRIYPSSEGISIYFQEITARKRADELLRRQFEMLQALYDASQEINHGLDIERLGAQIVRACVERFGARCAWLGNAEADGTVAQIAHHPPDCAYLHRIRIRWDSTPEGKGPTGRAIASGEPQITPDFATDPRTSPWRSAALADGIRTSAAFPLLGHEQALGALNVYSDQPGFFTPERVAFFSAYARLAAAAVENARLYRRIHETAGELRQLSRKLFSAQESERRHIARELHDEIGQLLTVIKFDLQGILRKPGAESAAPALRESIETIDQLVGRVRDLSLNLRPSMLDDLGLVPALRWYVQRQAKHLGIAIELQLPASARRLPPEIETASFRIVQEALTNAARHAQATRVEVMLTINEQDAELTVRDNGAGFDVAAAHQRAIVGGSFGLLGMQERAQLVGGELRITSAPHQGTVIKTQFPLRTAEETSA